MGLAGLKSSVIEGMVSIKKTEPTPKAADRRFYNSVPKVEIADQQEGADPG